MNIAYEIVGIAKGNREDVEAVYKKTGLGVFSLALSVTKSRRLAREIAVETFRRVIRYAYSFDTDNDGGQWIADICMQLSRNSLRDPAVRSAAVSKELTDNASALLDDTLNKLSGDRGTLIILKATMPFLRTSDAARLTGYYVQSAGAEQRRGIAALAGMDEAREKKNIIPDLTEDLQKICPDYLEDILSDRNTAVEHVSHEAMYLDDEVNTFSGGGSETEIVEKRENERKKNGRKKALIIAGAVLAVAVIAVVTVLLIVNSRRSANEDTPGETTSAQFGNSIDMLKIRDRLYYRGVSGGIYAYDCVKGGEPVRISDETAKELVTDGESLYFRSAQGNKIYRIGTDGGGLKKLCGLSGTTLTYSGGYIYFSGSDGIYAVSTLGAENDEDIVTVYAEETEDSPSRNHMTVTESGQVVFSGGADGGLFLVGEWNSSSVLYYIYLGEVYYFTEADGYLLFDELAGSAINLYLLDVDARKAYSVGVEYVKDEEGRLTSETAGGEQATTYSTAYCCAGQYIYYEGCTFDDFGRAENIGIYRTKLNSAETELLLELPQEGPHITEMFCDGDSLFCLYSDGLKDSTRQLVKYDTGNFENAAVIFSETRRK